ncbi:12608_t:CDS:2 [Acaulospora colombiana]|uniref:12608_t:CDS:1 n=1 Tax=Acaulospora colombiana TaxID=27376 RepID=A0ACA9KGE2_9GLOM|nr:12608_t:CDS:2 [Acaulospora colombiana]
MQFAPEESKSGWLTKLGGNALRKTWKRRWFELRGNLLRYYRQQSDKEPSGVINLASYNSICQDSSATKKSPNCIRIEKVARESDSIRSTASYRESSLKKQPAFLAFADTEAEMQEWIIALEKHLGGRNIADIVLDRLDLSGNIGVHRRQASYGSLSSFYSKNSNVCSTSDSALSSRRPSLDSLSLGTPSLDSRKSSIDSFHCNPTPPNGGNNGGIIATRNFSQPPSRPETPSNLVALFGLGQPILRKPASSSVLHDRRGNADDVDGNVAQPTSQQQGHVRKLSLNISKDRSAAPLIMVNGENSRFSASPDAVHFPTHNGIRTSTSSGSMHSAFNNSHSPFNSSFTSSALNGTKKKDSNNSISISSSASSTPLMNAVTPKSPVTPLANVFPSHLS